MIKTLLDIGVLATPVRIILPSRWKVKSRCRTPETLPIGIMIILSWCL